MKIHFKKSLSLTLAFIICLACFTNGFTFSARELNNDTAETNFDFAVNTAELIKNNGDSMLRILGRLNPDAEDIDFPLASDSVVSDDGRFVLQFSSEEKLVACLNELQNNPAVSFAERDIPVFTGTLKEAKKSLSWGVKAIEADTYSQSIFPSSGNSVTVAIVDSGCEDIDFIKNNLVEGYDFFNNDSDATDDTSDDSHGTFLASIVVDCVGNLPIKIMPVRVLDSKEGSIFNLINGIVYAVDNGADVINLSLYAALNDCKSLENALSYAEENGVTVVACAGNAASDVKDFCPAHFSSVLTVSSVNYNNVFSQRFSNYGDKVDLTAPGENILGFNSSGELTTLSGTSMSAAFVSAAAAMIVLKSPTFTPENVRSELISSAEDLGMSGKDIYYGFGVPKLSNIINYPEIKIRNNVGTKTIGYGETLRMTADITNGDGTQSVFWFVNGIKSGEGTSFEVSPKSGNINITAKLVDANGKPVKNKNGDEISDSQTVSVKSGFFQKLISFFKNLFGLSRIVIQSVTK